MKRYKEFINEGLLAAMKPKSEEDLLKTDALERITEISSGELDNKFYPSDEDILKSLNKYPSVFDRIDLLDYYRLSDKFFPSDEEILKSDVFKRLDSINSKSHYSIDKKFYPSDEEISKALYKLNEYDKITEVIIYGLDFSFLPKGKLVIDGDFTCYNKGITKLPDNLTVTGHLDIDRNNIKELPKGLVVGKTFDCNSNYLVKLPSDLYVATDIRCRRNNKVLELPSGATCGGIFYN